MLSTIPFDLSKINQDDLDKEILRASIIAELDAASLYEQFANLTTNGNIKAVLEDVAREEKTHAGEFQTLLLRIDPQQTDELEHGRREVEEIISNR